MLRTETERLEVVKASTVKSVGVDEEDIYNATSLLLKDTSEYENMAKGSKSI